MASYYTGGLPEGASIVTEFNPQNTYVSPAGQTLCFPWKLAAGQQLIISMADNTPFISAFISGVRAWPSREPAGPSITASPNSVQSSVILQLSGIKWGFWSIDLDGQAHEPSDINTWAYPGQTYWMNVQNLKNRDSYFYARLAYSN